MLNLNKIEKSFLFIMSVSVSNTEEIMPDDDTGCAMCGKIIKTKYISEKIDNLYYVFHSDDCAIFFKKFRSVYGKDFC